MLRLGGYKRINIFAPGFQESQRINPLELIESPDDMINAQELALSILQNNSWWQGLFY